MHGGWTSAFVALKTDFRDGEPGGNNIMIDGIVAELANTVDELRDLLISEDVLVDLTGDEPLVVVRGTEIAERRKRSAGSQLSDPAGRTDSP